MIQNEWIKEVQRLRAAVESLAWLCLSHGLISRGKFASLLELADATGDRITVIDTVLWRAANLGIIDAARLPLMETL